MTRGRGGSGAEMSEYQYFEATTIGVVSYLIKFCGLLYYLTPQCNVYLLSKTFYSPKVLVNYPGKAQFLPFIYNYCAKLNLNSHL